MGGVRPEGGQEGAWQHPGRAAGGNWREPGQAGGGAGQGPEVGKGPSASLPTSAELTHPRPHFFTTVPQNGQVGVWEIVFVPQAGPRPIPKSAIIDESGSKISEEVIYFCDSGSPFSEKMCQNCCKGCQILTSRSFSRMLPRSYGIGPGSAPRDLPSTCAGGQDDVSSQANSLKLKTVNV